SACPARPPATAHELLRPGLCDLVVAGAADDLFDEYRAGAAALRPARRTWPHPLHPGVSRRADGGGDDRRWARRGPGGGGGAAPADRPLAGGAAVVRIRAVRKHDDLAAGLQPRARAGSARRSPGSLAAAVLDLPAGARPGPADPLDRRGA